MSKLQNDETEPVTEPVSSNTTEEVMDLSVGVRLREAREAKDLELRDVALKTRQSQETLAALESEDTDHIPTSILRLQARNYARFLGLPEADIVGAFAEDRGVTNAASMPSQAKTSAFPTRSLTILGGVVVALVLVAGAVSAIMSSSDPVTEEDPLAISARLAPAFEQQASSNLFSADTSQEFAIRTLKPAWIEVRGSDGTVFRSREMRAGETYFPRVEAGWTITVRDAGAFEWRLGEISAGPIGEPGQALFSVSVDAALTAAIDAQSTALAENGDGGRDQR